jgi:hypothetical protein
MKIGLQRRKPQNTGIILCSGVWGHTHIHWETLGIRVWIDTQSIPPGRHKMPMVRL